MKLKSGTVPENLKTKVDILEPKPKLKMKTTPSNLDQKMTLKPSTHAPKNKPHKKSLTRTAPKNLPEVTEDKQTPDAPEDQAMKRSLEETTLTPSLEHNELRLLAETVPPDPSMRLLSDRKPPVLLARTPPPSGSDHLQNNIK